MNVFDIIESPLSSQNLIEAGAGTGKTYTIEGLYIRLILEKEIPVNQILVVTFTRAATEELKNRIRKKLLSINDALRNFPCDDPFVNTLIQKIDDPTSAQRLIQQALVDFDTAAIHTIHSFCQRILNENAFETNCMFHSEIISDQSHIIKEIAEDYWRMNIYPSPAELASYTLKKLSGPGYLSGLIRKFNFPDMNIMMHQKLPELKNLEIYRSYYNQLKDFWDKTKEDVIELLMDPILSGTSYGSLKPIQHTLPDLSDSVPDHLPGGLSRRKIKVQNLSYEMDRFTAPWSIGFPLFHNFELFTESKITHSIKKGRALIQHDFFKICDNLYKESILLEAEMDNYLFFLKTDFFKYSQIELKRNKIKSNVLGYDDLLVMLRQAIDGKHGDELKRIIRDRYKAVLLDEFQDTDSIQYDIFSRLFSTKDNILFLIGDPKQSIYGFRGADVFSYMNASNKVDSAYTLLENWRSSPGLITAVNTIFSNQHHPFLFEKISFKSATPGKLKPTDSDFSTPSMILWHMFSNDIVEKDKAIPKEEAIQLLSRAVTEEIAQLTSDKRERVHPQDIAVLVRTNRQADIIKQSLMANNIPAVLYHSGNIYQSHEALEVQRILRGIAEPNEDRLLKAALSTDILGAGGHEFEDLETSDFWEKRIIKFRQYSAIWKRKGFIRMFRLLMDEEKIKERLMAYADGERRLTNLLHISEILHQVDMEKNVGINGLIRWLNEKIISRDFDSDEQLLRLESDHRSVNIVTIHKSKGLEYPIVFCPFGWEGSRIYDQSVQYHDPENKNRLTLDLGSDNFIKNKKIAQHEILSENLRLLYVALTRAKQKCYFAWGRIRNADTSAHAYLLHYDDDSEDVDDVIDKLGKTISSKSDGQLLDELVKISDRSCGTIKLDSLPLDQKHRLRQTNGGIEKDLYCLNYTGGIHNIRKVASYSSLILDQYESQRLTGHIISEQSMAEKDLQEKVLPEQVTLDPPLSTNSSIHFTETEYDVFGADNNDGPLTPDNFPRGIVSGLFFHDVFENLDFSNAEARYQDELVKEKLKQYGFESKWSPVICKMINQVISTNLYQNKSAFKLSSVLRFDRINEMEFYYPLKQLTPNTLRDIFARYRNLNVPVDYTQTVGNLKFSLVEGYMHGFIDMVFRYEGRYYLLDWKSNYLGPTIDHYHQSSMMKAMADHHYFLQYHIYTLALHLYLKTRMLSYQFETDFGGIFYLFIRGMDPEKGPKYGVFYDRPSDEMIRELANTLILKQ